MEVGVTIQLTREDIQDLLSEIYQLNLDHGDTILSMIYKELVKL